tara:strand:- start:813 stop:1808 length:996 start_codon:yes stop_codon:yes gene_type:complete
MRVALISNFSESKDKVKNFTGIWSIYFPEALEAAGIDVVKIHCDVHELNQTGKIKNFLDSLDVTTFDHVVALGLRFFSYTPLNETLALKKRVKGCLGQIYDGGTLDSSPVDLTFTFRDDDWAYPPGSTNNRYKRHRENNKYIGWAADSEYLYPDQSCQTLRVLVDHPAFNVAQKDQTLSILMNLEALEKNKEIISKYGFDDIAVRQIMDGGVVDVDLKKIAVRPYKKIAVPFLEISKEYRAAHIFMVTHLESVGLSMLEAALAGGVVVAPKGLVPMDRLETINHVLVDGAVDWDYVLEKVNPRENSLVAARNSWEEVARKMHYHLSNFVKG